MTVTWPSCPLCHRPIYLDLHITVQDVEWGMVHKGCADNISTKGS
jgi:hypothetical protein